MGNVLLPIILITLPHVRLRVSVMGLPKVENGSWQPITASSCFLVSFCPGLMEEPGAEIGANTSGRVWQEAAVEGRVYSLGRGACIYAQLLSNVWSETPWTTSCQTPLSMGFLRQEYWSDLPFPPPGDLPSTGIKCVSCIPCIDRWILYHWDT